MNKIGAIWVLIVFLICMLICGIVSDNTQYKFFALGGFSTLGYLMVLSFLIEVIMDDRFKFICGVDVSYYSDDGDDKDVIVWFEPDSVTKYGEVGFDFDIIKNELKKLNLSQHEFDTAIDFIYSNYETSIQDWCVADPKHLLQCTGFNDKNGTLIFDNDILEIVNVSKTIRYVSPVVFDKKLGAFMVWGNEEKTLRYSAKRQILKECLEAMKKAQENYGYDDSICEILDPCINKIYQELNCCDED